MRVIIAGAGKAGRAVGVHLAEAGHAVTLLDRDPAVARSAYESSGLVTMTGDATEPGMLREAQIGEADVVVAMLPRDADNLAVLALARSAGARRTMVRVKDEGYRSIYVSAGADRILSEADVFIGALATAIEHDNIRASMFVGAGETVVFELELPERSQVAGKTVSTIAASPEFPASCVFAGLCEAGGRVEAPRGGSVIAPASTLLLVSRRSDLPAVIEFFMRTLAPSTPLPAKDRT